MQEKTYHGWTGWYVCDFGISTLGNNVWRNIETDVLPAGSPAGTWLISRPCLARCAVFNPQTRRTIVLGWQAGSSALSSAPGLWPSPKGRITRILEGWARHRSETRLQSSLRLNLWQWMELNRICGLWMKYILLLRGNLGGPSVCLSLTVITVIYSTLRCIMFERGTSIQ